MPVEIIIELTPPTNPADLGKFFTKISHLLNKTKHISIVSKPYKQMITGFEQSINLVQYLLDKEPHLDILFHLTCSDLNKVNITSRLALLRGTGISKILVVTGDNYTWPMNDLFYENSTKLLVDIKKHYDWFETIAIAGYPGGNGRQSHNNQEECERLATKLELGANVVYTQCIFEAEEFEDLKSKLLAKFARVKVIPSIAMFRKQVDLERIVSRTRVKSSTVNGILENLKRLNIEESESFAMDYLVRLCTDLSRGESPTLIDFCTFGHFEFTERLMNGIYCSSTINYDPQPLLPADDE